MTPLDQQPLFANGETRRSFPAPLALALEQILSDYFDVPVTVEQFMGLWYPL